MKVEPKPAFPELEKTVLLRWQKEQTFEQSLGEDSPEGFQKDVESGSPGGVHIRSLSFTA